MNPTPAPRQSLVDRLDSLYEYDREPVTEKDLHGWKIFWATFAGEHIAGTEFVLAFRGMGLAGRHPCGLPRRLRGL